MKSLLLDREISAESVKPCYLLHGEDVSLARHFLDELKTLLVSSDEEEFTLERCDLSRMAWMDVFDLAKTLSFFPTARLIVVDIPSNWEGLKKADGELARSYFDDPTPRTVLVFIYPFRLDRRKAWFKLFSSLPAADVCLLKSLSEYKLRDWVGAALRKLGKTASAEARERLVDFAGSNLDLLKNELFKIATFVGDNPRIEVDDVNQVSGWVKSFVEYELKNGLEVRDYEKCLNVLDKLINKEGTKPEYLLGVIAGFFREIYIAKLWLRDKKRDKKEIFRKFRPGIQEKFGTFYTRRFNGFFRLVEGVSQDDMDGWLRDLEGIDLALKTSDQSAILLFERFLYRFCAGSAEGSTSKGWG